MANISFGGLATGLDTESIITKLVSLEKVPANALETRKAAAQKRISILSDLTTKLRTLGTTAKAADTSAELRSMKTTVTGEDLAATAGPGVSAGRWTVKVDQLARAETSRSRALNSKDAGAAGDGSVAITVGSGTAVNVNYTAADSLDAIAARINDAGAGVSASVLFDGSQYRLTVTGNNSGAASAVSFVETGDTLGLADDGAEVVTARDAKLEIAGSTIFRSSNQITDVIPGVTLNLGKVTADGSDGTTVVVEKDPAGQRATVQKMVDAYNDVAKVLSTQLTYSGVKKGEDTLFGDSTLQAMQRRLGGIVGSKFTSGAGQVISRDLGITIQADGSLKLDATTFDKYAAEHPTAVDHLLAGETEGEGLAAQLSTVVEQLTKSGTGTMAAKQQGLRDRIAGMDTSIDRITKTADDLETRLRRQYSALEQLVSGMQSSMNFLASI